MFRHVVFSLYFESCTILCNFFLRLDQVWKELFLTSKYRRSGYDRRKLRVPLFLYDYKFERVWKQPDLDIEKLSRHRAVSKFMQRFGHGDSIDYLLHGSSGLGYGIVHNT